MSRAHTSIYSLISIVVSSLAVAGCNAILGLEPGEKPADAAAAGGGDGGTGAGGGGGDEPCEPGAKEVCYEGPAGTEDVGACRAGARVCRDDGKGFGACEGQVLPSIETCSAAGPADQSCNGYQCGDAVWGRNIGDAGFQFGESVAADEAGNVILVGSFEGTVDFGGGPITTEGLKDVFVAKYSAAGKHLWSRKYGNQSNQVANSVAVDAEGNVFVTGAFDGAIDFGTGAVQTKGLNDIFIAKLSPSGEAIWAKSFGDGTNQIGRAIAADGSGNVVMCGSFQGSVDFGDGVVPSSGDYDIFVVSFDADGGRRWHRRYGDSGAQNCEGIGVDAAGDVLLTGPFKGTVAFGTPALTSSGDFDSYVAKLAGSDGATAWSKAFGGLTEQRSEALAVDAEGNVLITGYMAGSTTFGGETLTSAGGADLFIVKLDPIGAHVWSRLFGDGSNQFAQGITTDAAGNVMVVGYFNGVLDFDGSLLIGSGGDDMFVARLDPEGKHVWSGSFGDASDQYATSVAAGLSGNLYVGGHIDGKVNLGNAIVASNGGFDAFLARFEP